MLLAVIVAAIASSNPTVRQATATTVPAVSEPTPEEVEGPPTTEAPTTTEPEPAPAKRFGQTTTYSDDTTIRVMRVSQGQIGPYAAGGSRARDVLVKVTVKITAGDEAIDLSPDVKVQYGTDGQVADTVFDTGIDAMQDAPQVLHSKRSVTGVFGFAVPRGKAGKLVVTATPGYEFEEATFEGRA